MNPNFSSKLSREERWEARKRAKFSQENSVEAPMEAPQIHSNPSIFQNNPSSFKNFEPSYQNYPPEPISEPTIFSLAQNIKNPSNLSPKQNFEPQKFTQQQIIIRGKTPPNNSFFVNPVSDAESKRLRMQAEYKEYAMQDLNRKKEDIEDIFSNNFVIGKHKEDQQSEDLKKKMYNEELKRQIQERENSKKYSKNQEKAEEYFPFGKPGAGAPYRDSSGRIIATRPPKFNENDPNFNKFNRAPNLPYAGQGYYDEGYPPSNIPQNMIPSNNPQFSPAYNQYPPGYPLQPYQNPIRDPSYQNLNRDPYQNPNRDPSYQMALKDPSYQMPLNDPGFYSNPSRPTNQYINEVKNSFNPNKYPSQITEERFEPSKEVAQSAEAQKKFELQRALQEQIEEKKRKKEEEKRRQILEEKYEEERLLRERQRMEEEFRNEAEKKKKQINDLQAFNNAVPEPVKRGRRPRTPLDMPPPEVKPQAQLEDLKKRGQSAITRNVSNNPNEIPAEYINFLNSALDKKLSEFKNEYKVQEIRNQEEILRLKTKNQATNEQGIEAQREIERLRDELRRKQVEEDIRQKELALALANTKNVVPINTRLPPYEPRPLILQKSNDDAFLSLDLASKSLVSESKFIPLPSPAENFMIKPTSPKAKKALNLETVFPSLPESNGPYETFRSASSSIGIDNILRKNEERLKALDKIDPDAQDELNKLDEILFKFSENKNNEEPMSMYYQPPRIETPGLLPKGEYLPSIKELDGEATYSLPDLDKRSLYNV